MASVPAVTPDRTAAYPSPVGIGPLIRAYRGQLPLFLGVLLLIAGSVAAYTFSRTPRYTATASVVVAPKGAEFGRAQSSALGDPTADSSVDTQVEVIRSPQLAARVAQALNLADPARLARLKGRGGVVARLRSGGGAPAADPGPAARRDAATRILVDGMKVHRVAQTFALEIAFASPDKALAAEVANGFADAYVRQSLAVKLDAARQAADLLGGQLVAAQRDADATEAAVGRYKVANNLMSVAGGTLAEQEVTGFDQQVALARANEAEATARWQTARRQVSRGSAGDDVGEALGSPVIQDLRRQRAGATRHVAELDTRYGARHPSVVAATREVADLDRQIDAEIGRTLSNLDAQRQIAAQRTASLVASMNGSRGSLAANNRAAVGLAGLQLRANAARTLYEELLGRVREVRAQAATMQPDARIAAFAAADRTTSSPNVPINLLVGLLLGVAGGIGAVVIRQGLDGGLTSLDEVEARLGLPYLAGLPTLASSVPPPTDGDPISAVLRHRTSAFAESYRTLAASALRRADGTRARSLLITSALPNEGKTTTAICLARLLASHGSRVLLIDADLRRPRIASALGLHPAHDLADLLEGRAGLDQVVVEDGPSGAAVLPLLPHSRFTGSPIEDGRMERLLDEMVLLFDVVVVDASPVLPVVDGRLLARHAEAVVLLAQWRKTPEAAVEMAAHLLAAAGVTPSGVALSRIDLKVMARTGYGDPAKFLGLYRSYYHHPDQAHA